MVRRRFQEFRILVIGRANAGKTTILKRFCNTREKPEIFDCNGKPLEYDASILEPTAQRGLHEIENNFVFQSNSQFVFHDSEGFEAGGVAELEKVKAFVASHGKWTRLSDNIHVIWYSEGSLL